MSNKELVPASEATTIAETSTPKKRELKYKPWKEVKIYYKCKSSVGGKNYTHLVHDPRRHVFTPRTITDLNFETFCSKHQVWAKYSHEERE